MVVPVGYPKNKFAPNSATSAFSKKWVAKEEGLLKLSANITVRRDYAFYIEAMLNFLNFCACGTNA